MQKKADLHIHTNLSDSTFSPQGVVRYAHKISLSTIAICDHDVVDGIAPAKEIAEEYGVEIIPGVEITTESKGVEIHILGYFINLRDVEFKRKLYQICNIRRERILEMVERLNKIGIGLRPEDVFEISGEGSVSRLHLAMALVKKRYVSSIPEAFRRYIGDGRPCYVTNKFNLSPENAIDEIIKAGGIPVLAHPGVMGDDSAIPRYIKHGLMGIEAYHSEHSKVVARHYERLAYEYGLLVTGGSDCHGEGKERILMGSVSVPYKCVERLKNANESAR